MTAAPHPHPRSTERVGSRVAASATLLWSGNMLLRLLQLVTTAILARILTPADYGLVALAMTVVGLIEVVSDLQLGGAIIRSRELEQAHLDSVFTIGLLRGLLTGLFLAAFAIPIAGYMHDARLENLFYALAVGAVIGGIKNPYFILFERNLEFRQEVWRNIVCALLGNGFGILVAILTRSYWALVIGMMANNALSMLLSYWRVPGRPRLSLARWRELFGFGGWLMLINVMNYVNGKLDYVLIGRGLGSTRLGAYHIGQQITTMSTGDVIGPASRAMFPAFALFSDDPARLRASYRRAQAVVLAVALPIGFGVSALAPEIVRLLVGPRWGEAVPVIRFLAPLIALQTLGAGVTSVALAAGRTRALFVRTTIILIVRGTLMFVGYHLGGFFGIIYARIASGTFFLIYELNLAAAITGGRSTDSVVAGWRSLLSVACMWPVLLLLPGAPGAIDYPRLVLLLGAKVALGAAIYVGVHALLWRLAGRPEGPESRLIHEATSVLRRVVGSGRISSRGRHS